MFWIHAGFLLLLLGTAGFFFVLDVINLRYGEEMVRRREDWIRDQLGVEDREKLLDYHRIKTGFSALKTGVSLLFLLVVLYSGLLEGAIRSLLGRGLSHWTQGVVFFLGVTTLGTLLSSPFSAFSTFVIEEIFGFNRQTPGEWFRDLLKGLGVGAVLTILITGALLGVMQWLPSTWWLAGWGLFVAFSLLMQVVYPRVIAPLFNDFEPVEEGELRNSVEDVFERAGFRCSEIYTMDASRRSSHSNAYFTGFGRTKRVVLFDTLLDQLGLSEVQAVLSHELAHWKKGHVWKRMIRSAARTGVLFGVLFWLVESSWVYGMFDLPRLPHAGLVVAGLWVSPLAQWLSPLENRFSIRDEREADSFAVEVMEGSRPLIEALCRMTGENLSNPFPHPLYAAFHYSHPPIPDRIEHLRSQSGEPSVGS